MASMTWEASVEVAQTVNRQALEGRFTLALVSFDQFEPFGRGYILEGGKAKRTLTDWCDEVGVSYYTLNAYRQIVSWWFESDPIGLRDEIGVPTHIAWEALKLARKHWAMVVDFRAVLEAVEPNNGKVFSLDDVEILARRRPPVRRKTARPRADSELFEVAMVSVDRVGARITRLLGELRDAELSDEQRAQLREAVDRARAPLDFLASYIDGGGSVEEFLAQRDRERLERAKATNRDG